MFDFLDTLRQKPAEVRLLITLVTAGTITTIIAIVWGISFAATLSKSSVASPIQADSLNALRDQLVEGVDKGKEVIDSLSSYAGPTTTRELPENAVSEAESVTGGNDNGTITASTTDTGVQTPTSGAGADEKKPLLQGGPAVQEVPL